MQTGRIIVVTLLVATLLTGCGTLIPKPVELGQRKIEAVPAKSDKQVEAEKQAAHYVAEQTSLARDAALVEHSSTNVLQPITEARDAAQGLSYSLGAPASPWTDSGAALAARLERLENRLDRALAEHREDVSRDVGKKIEGTGLVRVPYFLWLGLVAGALFVLWTGLKIAGALYPPVGVGVAGLSAAGRLSSRVVAKGFEQIVAGGESFKKALQNCDLSDEGKDLVLDLLRRHQMVSQDHDVQRVVRAMTQSPKV